MESHFAAMGPVFRPVSVPGWIISGAALAFAVHVFVAIDRHSHSGSDTLYAFFPYAGVTFLL